MQVLQFDNTHFDLFIQDEEVKRSIGTPNLCAAIDVYSRMITGFELTLNSINRQSVLETLVQSITPKDRYIENLFSKTDYYPVWEIQGFPVIMLVDNGMNYRSEDVKRFCMEYDIILEFAPIRTPKYKAYIENWFNILKEVIAFELSEDGFRPNIRKRLENPDFDPEANVIFTYQQSELWLATWILDESI
ncbi:MAG: transposase family protein [Candidatus Heimdallarchaeota archaeon]|nr:transposase family protein [Candidatus Heimdallarchaeota archaeon]